MKHKHVRTDSAPNPIGPYSQATELNGVIFTSGQIAIDPATGKLIDGDVREQSKRVFENLQAVLEAAGSNLEQVVKTTIFLSDMADFAVVNEIYAGYFGQSLPARSTVEVGRLPLDVAVEVDCIAYKE